MGGDPAGPQDVCGAERPGSGRESPGFTDRLWQACGLGKAEDCSQHLRRKSRWSQGGKKGYGGADLGVPPPDFSVQGEARSPAERAGHRWNGRLGS